MPTDLPTSPTEEASSRAGAQYLRAPPERSTAIDQTSLAGSDVPMTHASAALSHEQARGRTVAIAGIVGCSSSAKNTTTSTGPVPRPRRRPAERPPQYHQDFTFTPTSLAAKADDWPHLSVTLENCAFLPVEKCAV
jgi:hypothetical protein